MKALILYLFLVLTFTSVSMDKPLRMEGTVTTHDTGTVCASLKGQGKFSPDGKKIVVGTQISTPGDHFKKSGNLHIYDIPSGKITHLEGSSSSDRYLPNLSHSWYNFSWSPAGTLIKATYFTDRQMAVTEATEVGQGIPAHEKHYKLPLNVLKVWNQEGTLLYQRHCTVGIKCYFSADDQYLLAKERENPLCIFDAQTGKKLAELGHASWHENRMPVDPQNRWIAQTEENKSTFFYDFKNFLPLRKLAGKLRQFSQDGTLFITEELHESESENENASYFQEGKYQIYYCAVYNRNFEQIAHFATPACIRFDFSPNMRSIILNRAYNESEHHYDFSGKETACLTHSKTDLNPFEFLTTDGVQKIILIPSETMTQVTLKLAGSSEKKWLLNAHLERIFYTRVPHLLALADYDRVKYFFDTQKQTFTSCLIKLRKGLYKRKPIPQISQEGYYITTKQKDGHELCKLDN